MKKILVLFLTTLSLLFFAGDRLYAQGHGHRDHGRGYGRGHESHNDMRTHHPGRHDDRRSYNHYDRRPVYTHVTRRVYRPVVRQRYIAPAWAARHRYNGRYHIYFRDYHAFYDPYRNGYVYWNANRWVFSPSIPAFMAHVDLGRARIEVMGNIPLATPPETYYGEYVRRYPATINIRIPAPPLPPLP